jgi:hypothetical protein
LRKARIKLLIGVGDVVRDISCQNITQAVAEELQLLLAVEFEVDHNSVICTAFSDLEADVLGVAELCPSQGMLALRVAVFVERLRAILGQFAELVFPPLRGRVTVNDDGGGSHAFDGDIKNRLLLAFITSADSNCFHLVIPPTLDSNIGGLVIASEMFGRLIAKNLRPK